MGFGTSGEGGFGEDYRKSQERAKNFNKTAKEMKAKKLREAEDRLKKENKDKEVEDDGKGVDVIADQQGEVATKILEDAVVLEEEKPKRPGLSKLEQSESFLEKDDQVKKDDDVVNNR